MAMFKIDSNGGGGQNSFSMTDPKIDRRRGVEKSLTRT